MAMSEYYDCCEHCEHFEDEPRDEHVDPCPEGCDDVDGAEDEEGG